MFQTFLRLIGLGPKVDAIGAELNAVRDTIREVNNRLREDLALAAPVPPRPRRSPASRQLGGS